MTSLLRQSLVLTAALAACTPSSSESIIVVFEPDSVTLFAADYREAPALGNFGVKNDGERPIYVTPNQFISGDASDDCVGGADGEFAAELLTTRNDSDIRIDPAETVYLPVTYSPNADRWRDGCYSAKLLLRVGQFSVDGTGPAEARRQVRPESWSETQFEMPIRFTWDCDIDRDGYFSTSCGGDDCHDQNVNTHPDAPERCDAADNDCDSERDEDAIDAVTWYRDNDGDAYGSDETRTTCTRPSPNWSTLTGDCDDSHAAVKPVGNEVCYDGLDNNCSGEIDEGCPELIDTLDDTDDTDDTLDTVDTDLLMDSGEDTSPPIIEDTWIDSGGDTFNFDTAPSGPPPDADGDGVSDADETRLGTNPLDPDTDGDNLNDYQELFVFNCDPLEPDSDGDGFTDSEETTIYRTECRNPDTDGDGLNDREDVVRGTDPLDPDTDGDLLTDGDEVNIYFTDPDDLDSDNDALSDGVEVNTYFTDPNVRDTDDDGLNDYIETSLAWDPNDPDMDDDGLLDGEERDLCSDERNPDTDSDGLLDGIEVHTWFSDPCEIDTDGDGLTDEEEVNVWNTDPLDGDPDNDTVPDGDEILYQTDPFDADSDGDTATDGQEIYVWGTDPNLRDTDGDGLRDPREDVLNTDPLIADTDTDGFLDGDEVRRGTDPLNPNDFPSGPPPIDTGPEDTSLHTGDTAPLPAAGVWHRVTAEITSLFEAPTNPAEFFPGLAVGSTVEMLYRFDVDDMVVRTNSANNIDYLFEPRQGFDLSLDLASHAGSNVTLRAGNSGSQFAETRIAVHNNDPSPSNHDQWRVVSNDMIYNSDQYPDLAGSVVLVDMVLEARNNLFVLQSTDLTATPPELGRFDYRTDLLVNATVSTPAPDSANFRATVLSIEPYTP